MHISSVQNVRVENGKKNLKSFCSEKGVEFLYSSSVQDVRVENGRVQALRLDNGKIVR